MKNIINFISNIDNSTYNKIRHSKSDAECRRYLKEQLTKQLTLTDVSKRYDANKYTPPFRVGRKQGKAVLDGKGIEVVFFNNSEEQAKIYCDYLNNVC